ncbi:PhoX family phosphatase [Zoogloea sp.]|uniref:PhoX family protein n=1 Tax=Zoogloea sp. TaxID=49181 RepID=UPI00260E8171|nr:PhoX family phosphatase [Zoogloea sp.]MDD3352614.1 PhoX family phosphatase [Zoogloea sp.]
MSLKPSQATELSPMNDGTDVNPSSNTHIDDIIAVRMSRRGVLKGGIAATTAAVFGSLSMTACGGDDDNDAKPLALNFDAVAKNKLDMVTVPTGYQVSVLHALGDPLTATDAVWANDGSETPASYNNRIGCGHDGMHYFGLSDNGSFQANRSDKGVLCVNHEYVVSPYGLHPNGRTAGATRLASEVEKEINAHGVSVCEVTRAASGTAMSMTRGSRFNRRITSATPMAFSGPMKGNTLARTKYSPDGTTTRGTNNNCGNGYTPWGTYLTCEENFTNVISRAAGDDAKRSAKEITGLKRYNLAENKKSSYLWDTAGTDDLFARWSASVTGASAAEDYRNIFNTFGWIVEIDPFDPTSTPLKHSALGRFAHEGCWPCNAVAGKPIVFYMGDDSRNEYIFKFVSKALWDSADVGKGHTAGLKYMSEGTLYVARFNADGSGQWIELTHGKNGLDASNATYAFADQADVVTHARLAGDAVGATKMDRPEWGAVHPTNGEIYMTLTNNSYRVAPTATPTGSQLKPDTANPRYYEDIKDGSTSQKGNPNGHIIRWREAGSDPAATTFTWDIYLFGAEAGAAADVNLSGLTDVNDFSSPDGLWFDKNGMLWIQTDDGAYTDVTNCMMLAAVPGKVGDGTAVVAAGGTPTLKGANATNATVRRFLVGPKDCEVTGIAMTPDRKTMFVNIQHPGEDGSLSAPTSTWPAGQSGARPRSATVVITRSNGGEIAV